MDTRLAGLTFVHFDRYFLDFKFREFEKLKVGDWLWIFKRIICGEKLDDFLIAGAKAGSDIVDAFFGKEADDAR